MGYSSSKPEKPEPSNTQTININLKIEGLDGILSSKNISTQAERSKNEFSILGEDAPPSIVQQQNQINSQNVQNYNINVNQKNGNISVDINNNSSLEFSTNQNIDNNNKNDYLKKRNEGVTDFGHDINPNIKIDENLYQKKETSKGSKYKEEINPNIRNSDLKNKEFSKPSYKDNINKYNPENHQFFTKTGDNIDNNIEDGKNNINSPGENKDNNEKYDKDEKKNIDSPGENKDNNEKYDHPLDISKGDLAQSILLASFQNLNIADHNDMLKLKDKAIQKYNEGYFPLFVKMNHSISFYYLKQDHTLNNLLLAHLNSLKIPYNSEKYSFYKDDHKLNPDIPVIEIDCLPILSVINIKKE